MNNQTPKAGAQSFVKLQTEQFSVIKKDFTPEQLKFVKGLVNPDLSESELYLFIAFANKVRLNPFTKEIIAVVYNKDNPTYRRVNFIVTRDGKRNKAAETGELNGLTSEAIYIKEQESPVLESVIKDNGEVSFKDTGKKIKKIEKVQPWEGGTLWGATATVRRGEGERTVTIPLSEYDTKKNVWADKPSTMIKKVAESQALSLAFPDILSGLNDESEMGSVIPEIVDENADEPATQEQLELIESMGGKIEAGLTYGGAKKLTKELTVKRARKGATS